jgi:hypothetical protein
MKLDNKLFINYLWGGAMSDEIIHLLSERNRYLSQFSVLNKVQIEKLKKANFEQLSEFYMTREHILAVVEKIELLLSQKLEHSKADVSEDGNRSTVEGLLVAKDKIIREILDQDLEILSTIEKEKSNILSELKTLKKGRTTISAYKSGITSSKLDEEA